jgi:hypothetical protein
MALPAPTVTYTAMSMKLTAIKAISIVRNHFMPSVYA